MTVSIQFPQTTANATEETRSMWRSQYMGTAPPPTSTGSGNSSRSGSSDSSRSAGAATESAPDGST